jgi:DNA-binding MarR family transcriptional regulator
MVGDHARQNPAPFSHFWRFSVAGIELKDAELVESANKYVKSLDAIINYSQDIKARQIQCLLMVYVDEGRAVSDYADKIKMKHSTMSRYLLDLGEKTRKGGAGLELVKKLKSHEDLRKELVFLTAKGRSVVGKILQIIHAY